MPSICALENLPPSEARDNDAASGGTTRKRYPTKREVLAVIPPECFERSLIRSSLSLLPSLAMTVGSGALAHAFIPLAWSWLPAWIGCAIVAGTAGTGCWVAAHECGHRAFAKYNWLQDAIGYCLHSGLLVPYFSWQRSHAVHHGRTNHRTAFSGRVAPKGLAVGCRRRCHARPARLVGGFAGFLPVLAVHVGPYPVVNFWLVLYTWLQHTDVDTPRFDDEDWTWVKGAFMTVDRPYGGVLDFMHHHIGSTHVPQNMDARIPHYHAVKATRALQENFSDLYRHDPTPTPKALWRVATRCQVVSKEEEGWSSPPQKTAGALKKARPVRTESQVQVLRHGRGPATRLWEGR